jgi:hypothetical protein
MKFSKIAAPAICVVTGQQIAVNVAFNGKAVIVHLPMGPFRDWRAVLIRYAIIIVEVVKLS